MSILPVASKADVRAAARRLVLARPRRLASVVALHGLAAVCGLVAPRALGDLVERAADGSPRVGGTVLVVLAFTVVQAVILRFALMVSARLGETVLADLRETFVDTVLSLPLAVVERTGSGDLVTRSTRDVDVLSSSARQAVPDSLAALTTVLVTLGALITVAPPLVLPCLLTVPVLWGATRWFGRRARAGYLRVSASYADIAEILDETVEGARTVDALRLGPQRSAALDTAIDASYRAERATLRLRTVYLPVADVAYILPTAATLAVGGLLYLHGSISLAAVTASTLYAQALIGPADRLLFWANELQVAGASLARLLGVHDAARSGDRPVPARHPVPAVHAADIAVQGVGFAYREERTVLHDVTLHIRAGERLAVVGPSGAGKSTLGRLLAGIHAPSTGSITVEGTPLADLPLEEMRRHIALVTQEHHVFHGTLRDNLTLVRPEAPDDRLEAALKAVGASEWATELGLDAHVGRGAVDLSPAQVQQLALARLILADPHTLVLDEATAMLAPRAARQLERSLASVSEGRTVIAIAHRLHTAHDADRIVVMNEGRVTEFGTHDELLARKGEYADLWTAWQGR